MISHSDEEIQKKENERSLHMIASHGAPDIIISGHDFSSFRWFVEGWGLGNAIKAVE
ncbi:unnamed protein product [Dovyalis caffra]|uniref:Uncharacterized protein n=1 Tax=Dovyalis caffra TaxID=77055 RepID=A0AAV1SAU9_9ROSI|nr:unnamed protein product [Dovyalis caffra]